MNPQSTESHDTLPERLLEMWDALDPVDAWRPPLKEAAAEIERMQAQVAQQAAEVQRLRADAERYRWLRATTNWASSKGERVDVRNNPGLWDSAIDAAIQARQDGAGEPG